MHLPVIAIIILAALVMGCASTSSEQPAPESAVSAGSADSVADTSVSAAVVAESPKDIPDSCRTPVASFLRKFDGTLEVLTARDGNLLRVDAQGHVTVVKSVGKDVSRYFLLPLSNTIIHLYDDRISMEDDHGKELFRLDGDPAVHDISFNSDATELAIQKSSRKYNVWKTEKGFGAIAANERVQDFVNRQKPDHFLTFPGDVKALSLGTEGHVALAMNDEANGKIGLLYHLDSIGEPGKLQVIARTNTQVRSIVMSPNYDSVCAIDESGQLFAAGTDKKGFYGFSKDYTQVRQVVYHGSNPIIVQENQTTQIDYASGTPVFSLSENYDACAVYGKTLYCSGNGQLDIRDAYTGDLLHRYGFARTDAECHIAF